jgi:hypothetical protein
MSNPQLFQFAIIWHPTEKDKKENGTKSKLLIEPTTILADSPASANMSAAMQIPQEYKDQLDQIVIALRPF